MPVPFEPSNQSAQQRMPSLLADYRDFLVSADPMAQALYHVSGYAQDAARTLRSQEQQKEILRKREVHNTNVRWAGEATYQLKNITAEWMANPDNNSREDFDSQFIGFMDSRIEEYGKNAPTPEAYDMFKSEMQNHANSRFAQASSIAAQTRVDSTLESFQKQSLDVLSTYRTSSSLPGSNANQELVNDLQKIHKSIDESIGGIAPKTARALKAQISSYAIIDATALDAEFAQYLLDNEPLIEADARRSLQSAIDSRKEVRDITERLAFDQTRVDRVTQAQVHGDGEKIPISLYRQYYPDDRAQTLKARDDHEITVSVKAKKVIDEILPLNESNQIEQVNKMQENIKTEQDADVFKLVANQVERSVRLQREDPVSWLMQSNPEVKVYAKQLELATNQDERILLFNRLNEAILRYQGSPDENQEGEFFLNRPLGNQSILSMQQAKEFAGRINNSPPSQVLDTFYEIMSSYPDKQHQMVALNDMVTLTPQAESLRPEYQLVIQNAKQPWIDTFVGALAKSSEIRRLSEETQKDVIERIGNNPMWSAFAESMMGDNSQMADQVLAFREGIATYAHSMVLQGKSAKFAVSDSINKLLGSTLAFVNINGQALTISRERDNPERPYRTQEDVDHIENSLSLALAFIDPREVDFLSSMPSVEVLEGEERYQKIRDNITATGFYRTTPDGQGAILYMQDESGFPFQLKDKNGKPFTIYFDDIPSEVYIPEYYPFLNLQRWPGEPEKFNMRKRTTPKKTYELKSRGPDGKIKTNWPVRADWIK